MSTHPSTTPVRAAHRIDLAALERYLAVRVPEAAPIQGVSQFAAGQSNPTYLLDGPEKRFVLRKKPPGTLLPSAHLVEREYRILAALAGTDVPVPRVHHLCEDTDVIGTAFYVMDHVEGSVDQDPAWPAFTPAERGAAYRSIAVGTEPRWPGRVRHFAIRRPSPSVSAVEKSILSRSTPEYVVRQTVSAISSAMAKMAFLNSLKPKGSPPPARSASAAPPAAPFCSTSASIRPSPAWAR